MKKLVPLVITAVFLALAIGTVPALTPTAVAQQAENSVVAEFSTCWIYDSWEDTFTNAEVTGKQDWHANMGSGVPLTLTLDSALSFDSIMKENLTTTGPPTYVWSGFPQGTGSDVYVGFGSLDSPDVVPVTFTPGFEASRSVDRTEFSAPGTQTLTITVTPRVDTEQLGIMIFADENGQVNPVITSPISGDGIELRQEGHWLVISPAGLALNTTWTISVTIQITPKVPEVEYLPYVSIGWREPIASGTAIGNSFSFPVADMGTWTLSADGSYEWGWTDELIRQVCWQSYSGKVGEGSKPAPPLKGNQVFVGFLETLNYSVSGDSFTNYEVSFGGRLWRIPHIENIKDETGEPVRGLKVTLDSDQAFDWVGGWGTLTTKMGPPTYEWFYGDLGEDYTGHPKDAYVGWWANPNMTKFTPGFDVSRSFDKTVFTTPDTQTVTVTVTRREESFERLLISVGTEDNTDMLDAVIISQTAECDSEIDPGGHYIEFGIPNQGIPAELNTPLTVTATIQVTPKVPIVEYKPHVHIAPNYQQETYHNIVEGGSFSYTNEAGTWTVSAEGNYVWNWNCPAGAPLRGSVDLMAEGGKVLPTLTSAGVSPPSGTPKTDFTFEVTYEDADRNPPSYVRVYIDGSKPKDMDFWGGNYLDGALYLCATTLSPGSHVYYFEASDGFFTTRFPENGTLSIEVSGEDQGPAPAPALGQAISWQVLAGIVAGVVIIGLAIYFFIRRRGRRAAQ